jgi:ABC-type amino acid transport system permease subunit
MRHRGGGNSAVPAGQVEAAEDLKLARKQR